MSKRISKERFDVYAIGSRRSSLYLFTQELSWWSDLDETIIGTVIFEDVDKEYAWVILVRDENGRFRSTGDVNASYNSFRRAEAELRLAISDISRNKNFSGVVKQNDVKAPPLDLLTPLSEDRSSLHPYFVDLCDNPAKAPARAVIREIGRWIYPQDRHFIKEFQMHQFDQRLWELYLWASFKELGYDVEQYQAPDFECKVPLLEIDFTVEATTVAPSQQGVLSIHPSPKTNDEYEEFLQTYMPMKFGSALTGKLNKVNEHNLSYWERDHSMGKPFVIAVADFHKNGDTNERTLGSMTYSQGALYIYLYGQRVDWNIENGKLLVRVAKVTEHNYKDKKIPSGFFDLPGAENISGVMFSNAGTIAKFDRIGVCAGFAAPNHFYFRTGFRFDPDPNAFMGDFFHEQVGVGNYKESWCDELQFFHNPNARFPIPPFWLKNVAQHIFTDGQLYSLDSKRRILSSMTTVFQPAPENKTMED